MKTSIPEAALADPDIALSNDIIRDCVHCGICLSHCPTYQVRHDENDSPRGRILLMRHMYEQGGPDAKTVEHLDRCLTCLACEAICPSGVRYSKLVGHGRQYIEETYRRPLLQRAIRHALTILIQHPRLFRLGLSVGKLSQPFKRAFSGSLRAMLEMTPRAKLSRASDVDRPQVFPARGARRARVSILNGCVQTVLDPRVNEATIRLLQRHGVEVVVARGAGCCGAPAEHMGLERRALPFVKANIDAWLIEADEPGCGLDAIIVNTSGCGTSLKAYGHALRLDDHFKDKAARVSSLTKDITEFLTEHDLLPQQGPRNLRVAYQSACSMQHGQRIVHQPLELLRRVGFSVLEVPDGFMCCGSAGVYNLLQPEIARELKMRKAASIRSVGADIVATGNIGCMTQLATAVGVPMVHTVELLDWATGGPKPEALRLAAAIP